MVYRLIGPIGLFDYAIVISSSIVYYPSIVNIDVNRPGFSGDKMI